MTQSDAKTILGDPSETELGTIPAESIAGLQAAFQHKLFPGDTYLQWKYYKGDQSYYFWFARDDESGEWRLSMNAHWPSIVDGVSLFVASPAVEFSPSPRHNTGIHE